MTPCKIVCLHSGIV